MTHDKTVGGLIMSHFWRDFNKTTPYEQALPVIYHKLYPYASQLIHLAKEFDADYLIKDKKAELKVDFTKHPNFFFEKIKNVRKNKLGGPWQSLYEYHAKWFLYWFVSDKNQNQWNLYVFDNKQLIKWLDMFYNNYRELKINNEEYESIGIAVPITDMPNSLFKIKKMEYHND